MCRVLKISRGSFVDGLSTDLVEQGSDKGKGRCPTRAVARSGCDNHRIPVGSLESCGGTIGLANIERGPTIVVSIGQKPWSKEAK